MHYWDTRKELAANYPGKACKLPSVSQEKYWRFVSNFMKENCNKDKTCSKAEINQGLVDAVKAYKAQLSVEATDGQCVDSSLL